MVDHCLDMYKVAMRHDPELIQSMVCSDFDRRVGHLPAILAYTYTSDGHLGCLVSDASRLIRPLLPDCTLTATHALKAVTQRHYPFNRR